MLGRVWTALRRMAAPAPVCVPVRADVHDIAPPRMPREVAAPRERPLPIPGNDRHRNELPGIGLHVLPAERLDAATAIMRQIQANRAAEQPRRMDANRLAEALVAWMQRECTDGWVLLREIEAALDLVCADLNVLRIQTRPVLECLASLPGVKTGRYRLNMPEFAEVARRHAATDPRQARAVLWYIPASSADAQARLTAHDLARHRATRGAPGPSPATSDARPAGGRERPVVGGPQRPAMGAAAGRSGYAPAVADLFDAPRRAAA